MRHHLYYHIVWTTRDRRPLITAEVAAFLDRYIRAICGRERCRLIDLGMVTTHLHLLVRAHPMAVIPRLMQRLKGGSSAITGQELGLPHNSRLRWAAGYSIKSVSPSHADLVRAYVRSQARRHPAEAIARWDTEAGVGDDNVASRQNGRAGASAP